MYIPIWIIIITVVTYFFWAKRKKQGDISKKDSGKFVGRYQQVLLTKKFLGEEIPDLELQIAVNKDNLERDEFIAKLEDVEEYIKSDMFTNDLDVESVNKDMRDLIGEGYNNCVLTNDTTLENRCFKIFDDAHKYLESSLKKQGDQNSNKFTDLSDQIRSLLVLECHINHILLGGLLNDDSDEQKTWLIFNSLNYSNGLVKTASSLLPIKPAAKKAEALKDFANKLFKQNKISSSNLSKINSEIEEGLALGKEYYRSE